MEDCIVHSETKKRHGDELVHDPKRSRLESLATGSEFDRADSVPQDSESGRADSVTDISESDPVDNLPDRVDSVGREPESPDTIQLTDEILDILGDTEIDSSIQGLDSVIKSFEEEITSYPVTESGELDYLLGASDDELGLPPATKSPSNETPEIKTTESVTSPYQNMELKEDFAFVDELHVYDSAEFGLGEDNYDRTEFITLGNGLFDYSETPDYLWHPESLTAL